MIYLITATPGGGKTLLSVEWCEKWIAEGRQVYTNIDGMSYPGVKEAPEDWRDAPEGSVWILDEAQEHWPSTGRPGPSEQADIVALEKHRHTGHDIVILTQHPTFIHHHIRKLVGYHAHIERISNSRATIFQWYKAQDVSDGLARNRAEKRVWKYPKHLFGYYVSATAHTHRVKIPRKLILLAVAVVLILGGGGWAFSSSSFLFGGEPEPVAEERPASDPGPVMVDRRGSSSSGLSAGAVLVGGSPEGLDGAKLSEEWRLVGAIVGEDKSVFMIRSKYGDRQTVPGEGWEVRRYNNGLLTVDAPGGRMKIAWHTPLDNGRGRTGSVMSSSGLLN